MAVEFKILPERGLVVVICSGFVMIDDFVDATKIYLAHPDYAAGQKQLIDLTDLTGFEKDYVRFMKMQAEKAERLAGLGVQSIAVYVAPTPISRDVSAVFVRSWGDVDAVIPLVQHTEAEALALLGQPETTIEELLLVGANSA